MFKVLNIAYFHTYFWTIFKSSILINEYVSRISLHNEGQHISFHPKTCLFLRVKSMCRLQSKEVMGENRKKRAK
jgi:hypothetical protein